MTTHILVVNDTQDILEIFRLLLEDEGYKVTLSSFPLQKVGEITRLDPDLIILDVVFGEEKLGWQMLQLLKMQPATASIPVIICTASEKSVREMEGYLVSKNVLAVYKPFELQDEHKV
jgi:CheY-like chemotaxis protein